MMIQSVVFTRLLIEGQTRSIIDRWLAEISPQSITYYLFSAASDIITYK